MPRNVSKLLANCTHVPTHVCARANEALGRGHKTRRRCDGKRGVALHSRAWCQSARGVSRPLRIIGFFLGARSQHDSDISQSVNAVAQLHVEHSIREDDVCYPSDTSVTSNMSVCTVSSLGGDAEELVDLTVEKPVQHTSHLDRFSNRAGSHTLRGKTRDFAIPML